MEFTTFDYKEASFLYRSARHPRLLRSITSFALSSNTIFCIRIEARRHHQSCNAVLPDFLINCDGISKSSSTTSQHQSSLNKSPLSPIITKHNLFQLQPLKYQFRKPPHNLHNHTSLNGFLHFPLPKRCAERRPLQPRSLDTNNRLRRLRISNLHLCKKILLFSAPCDCDSTLI